MKVSKEERGMKYALALILALTAGCSGSQHDTAPVEGIVKLDGKPLSSAIVTFFPESGRSASGVLQEDGSYVLGTYTDSDGAIPGKHKVAITAFNQASKKPDFDNDRPNRSDRQSTIPVRYANPESSGLTYEVKAGEANNAPFELVSSAKKK